MAAPSVAGAAARLRSRGAVSIDAAPGREIAARPRGRAPVRLVRQLKSRQGARGECARRSRTAAAAAAAAAEVWEESFGKALAFGVSAAQGMRDSMEDRAAVVPKAFGGFLFAGVFDGHAGPKVAQYLAENLYSQVETTSADLKDDGADASQVASLLPAVFHKVDEDVLSFLNREKLPPEEAGSTATCVLARSDKLVVANVGDSRAVLCRSGKAVDLSVEHRAYGKGQVVKDEKARIAAVGGWVKSGRVCDMLAVTRAFGDAEFKGDRNRSFMLEEGVRERWWSRDFADSISFTGDPVVATPDVSEVDVLATDEFVIIASDGLWDVYSSGEAVSLLRREYLAGATAQDMADLIVDRAIKRKTQDNVIVVVLVLASAAQAKAAGKKKKGVLSMFG